MKTFNDVQTELEDGVTKALVRHDRDITLPFPVKTLLCGRRGIGGDRNMERRWRMKKYGWVLIGLMCVIAARFGS